MASDKPGKLKFNAAMFNPAAMKPGAKNKKLEELKNKRTSAPTQPLKTTDDQFSRPSVPRRRAKSKQKIKLDNEEKDGDEIYNQSYINNDPIMEQKETDYEETKSKESTMNKLDNALKDRKEPQGYIEPNKIAPSIQNAAKQLAHAKKTDDMNHKIGARQDIDEMLDSGIISTDPRKVHGSLHESQVTLSKGLENRASKQFLQRTKVLKYDKIDASIQPAAEALEQKLNTKSPSTPFADDNKNIAPALAATSKQLDKALKSDKLSQGLNDTNRTSLVRLQEQGIVPSDNVAPALAATSKQLDKAIKTDKLSQSLNDENRKTAKELSETGVLKYSNISGNLVSAANKLENAQIEDKLNKNIRNRADISELAEQGIHKTVFDHTQDTLKMAQQKDQLKKNLGNRGDINDLTEQGIHKTVFDHTQNTLKMAQQKDQLSENLRNREDIDKLHESNIITPNVAPQFAAKQRELDRQKKRDLIQQKLNDKDRPTADELQSQDILYNQQIAASLQGNAKDLEEKMREIQHEKSSNPSIDQSPTQTDIDELNEMQQQINHDSIEKHTKSRKLTADFLEEFLENRFDYDEIADRGIIQEIESTDSAHNAYDNDYNIIQTEIVAHKKRITKTLESRLSLRKTPQELENFGIVPPDYFDDPAAAYEMRLIQRKLAEEDLKRNLKSKPSPQDLVDRGFAHDEFWEKSVHETHTNRKNAMEQKKKKLAEAHRRRPSIQDLVADKIMPEDSEVIAELKNIAKAHKRMESAVNDLSQRLPFEDETNKSVAETMMKHINDTEDDIDLFWSSSEEEDEDEEQGYRARGSEEESDQSSEKDSDIDYDASSDIEIDPQKKPKFDLESVQRKNHKRRLSQDLENFYANRRTIEELEDDGVLKQTNIANSLRGSAVALEEAMNNMPHRQDLISKGVLKRPSISRSLQPNAEALEAELLRNLAKFKSAEVMELRHIEQEEHPLFKRDIVHTAHTAPHKRKRGHQRKKSSGFGTKKNMNPEYYKHDIAPKLQHVANTLHKRRISQQIEQSLNARPSKAELIDQRILYKEHMANQLQGNAMKLEEQLRQRVPEKYLKMIGVLIHDQEKVAPSIQAPSYELEYALRRRPSLFDGTTNSDMIRILGIPTDHDDHHAFYTNQLFRDGDGDNDSQPLVISAFEEMYPDDNDKSNYKLRRARNCDKLEKRMSVRMAPVDLEKTGIIPPNYWDDPSGAIEMKQIHRKLAAEDLKRGLRNRSTKQELIDRGLTRAEYLDMDMDKAKKAIVNHSHSTKQQVENQLNSIFNPQLIELEKRGIVESGYFLTRAKQIEDGHRRLVSVTSELQQKLLSNPSYNEELAKTLVQDLHSESDNDNDNDSDGHEHHDSEDEYNSDSDTDSGSNTDSDADSESEFMDSDDEEQARRLQELEYKIGHRPSTDELITKKILYKKMNQVAPAIQGNAQQLQKVIAKRPSIQVVSEKGILKATNQDGIDVSTHVVKGKHKHKHKHKHKPKKKHLNSSVHKHLNKKVGRRRPTMIDLEKRGIVPTGYFDDVEQAMVDKKIRKENIIHDLTSRLQSRPEFSEKLASKLMSKAMDSIQKQSDIIESGKNEKDKKQIQQILNAKLVDRLNVTDLKNKNILSSSYDHKMSHKLNANAEALRKQHLKQSLQNKLNAQPTEDELYDTGYIKFKRHGHNALSSTFHGVAVELEPLLNQRPDEEYLEKKGIINPIHKRLNEAMKSRPSIGQLEQGGLVPHGAFENLAQAKKAKHDRVQSIHDELNAFFKYDRPEKQEIIEAGIFNMPSSAAAKGKKKRGSIELKNDNSDTDTDESDESDGDHSDGYNNSASPDIPPVPERPSSMFQQNTYTEIVMNSITFHNKKAVEPSYSIELLVSEPDLSEDIIQTSTLSFLNVLDNLNRTISDKIEYAKGKYIDVMKSKSSDLQSLKNLLRALQQYGLAIAEEEEIDGIEFFESCGDLDKDIDNVWKEINTRQEELYKLDSEYMDVHVEIKNMQNIRAELSEYCDRYKIQLSQLKRVHKRITTYIEENKMVKDSSNEAMKATDSNQAWMISKITNKIVKLQNKIENSQENSEEYVTCHNFLNGLKEFLKGLKKLRKSSNDKIEHLQSIIDKLKEQQTDILSNIKEIRSDAIRKLGEIRETHFFNQSKEEKSESKYENMDSDEESDVEIVDFSNNAPLSMLELMHKREKYMTKVYKKIHDLESRAMTTSSTDYLRGLTEIRELQIILNNSSLKYFYNHFVSECNEIFNDCCLANQAILENTSEINAPLLTQLKGIKVLNDVLAKNKRKLSSDNENTMQYLDNIVVFIQSLPDREVVIMQIARHLSLSLPFRSFITGKDEIMKEREREKRRMQSNGNNDQNESEEEENEHHLIKIDKFINNKIREWVGSILNIYGNNAFSSVKVALDNDVVAQVRPSYAARLIVNCVYGLDVSL